MYICLYARIAMHMCHAEPPEEGRRRVRRGEGRYIDTDALQTSLRHSSDALAVRSKLSLADTHTSA